MLTLKIKSISCILIGQGQFSGTSCFLLCWKLANFQSPVREAVLADHGTIFISSLDSPDQDSASPKSAGQDNSLTGLWDEIGVTEKLLLSSRSKDFFFLRDLLQTLMARRRIVVNDRNCLVLPWTQENLQRAHRDLENLYFLDPEIQELRIIPPALAREWKNLMLDQEIRIPFRGGTNN